jgi:RNA polymerase subunit RPABC4/transcription elongation factor Spt4
MTHKCALCHRFTDSTLCPTCGHEESGHLDVEADEMVVGPLRQQLARETDREISWPTFHARRALPRVRHEVLPEEEAILGRRRRFG